VGDAAVCAKEGGLEDTGGCCRKIATAILFDIEIYHQVFDQFASVALFGSDAEPLLDEFKESLKALRVPAELSSL
jgi:hypothetical protein